MPDTQRLRDSSGYYGATPYYLFCAISTGAGFAILWLQEKHRQWIIARHIRLRSVAALKIAEAPSSPK
jgi:hypothetical protein